MSIESKVDFFRQEIIEAEIRQQQKKFDYNTVSYRLEYLVDKISQQEIDASLCWDQKKQSYFIESLLLGLPVLEIVIKQNDNDTESAIDVIDGKQRLYTTINFINNHLALNGLEKLVMLNGFKFKDMVLSRQRGNLGYGDFLTQSVNSQANSVDLTQVQLSFEHIFEGHWQEFKIIRAWQRNPQDGKDSLSIERESRFDSNLEEHWDEYIENILPLGISNLFLFDGEQVKELAELDTPPPAVVEAINNLLGLELAEKLSLDLEVLVNRKRKALANKTQLLTIEEIETKLVAKQQEKAKINHKLTELQQQLELANKKRDRARNKFNKQGGKFASQREQIEAKLRDFNAHLETKRQELITLASGCLPLKLIAPLLSAVVDQGKKELEIQQFKQAQGVLAVRDRKLLDYLASINLADESISKVEFFLAQENKQIAKSINNEADSFLHLTELELQQLISNTQDILPLQTKSTYNVVQQIKQLELEKERTESQLAIAASPEDYQQLLQAVETTQQDVSNCKALYKVEQEKFDQLTREIERIQQELNRKLKNYSEDAIDNINDEHIIKTSAKVQQTLKLFKEKLTLKKLNKLETEVKDCFLYLLHKSNLINRVTIDSDRFKLELYDHQGQLFPKQRLSAGEKQLLAIAFLWGLARVSGRNLPQGYFILKRDAIC